MLSQVTEIEAALGLGHVPDDDILTVLAGMFGVSTFQASSHTVTFSSWYERQRGSVTISFGERGQIAAIHGNISDETLDALQTDARALLEPAGEWNVLRSVMSSEHPLTNWWRDDDDWQIVPATDSQYPHVTNPFILEYRVRRFSVKRVTLALAERRLWELRLTLGLLLGMVITQTSESIYGWDEDRKPASQSLRQEFTGTYTIFYSDNDYEEPAPTSTVPIHAFSEPAAKTDVTPPAILLRATENLGRLDPESREKFHAACYWLEIADQAWSTSKSLSFLSAINAIEALVSEAAAPAHRCWCGTDHHPGLSAGFKRFVRKYAPPVRRKDIDEMYKLRSKLVHGGALHELDIPSPWRSVVPVSAQGRHFNLHGVALRTARIAVREWLLRRDDAEPKADDT
jgi:hypothetical protein